MYEISCCEMCKKDSETPDWEQSDTQMLARDT
jgi:hypothetical protein